MAQSSNRQKKQLELQFKTLKCTNSALSLSPLLCKADHIFRNTYIFEESLHEREHDIMRHSTRVCSVDMLFITRGQLLRLLVFAAVSEHWKPITEVSLEYEEMCLTERWKKKENQGFGIVVRVNAVLGQQLITDQLHISFIWWQVRKCFPWLKKT